MPILVNVLVAASALVRVPGLAAVWAWSCHRCSRSALCQYTGAAMQDRASARDAAEAAGLRRRLRRA